MDFKHLNDGRKIILLIDSDSHDKLDQDQKIYFHDIVKTRDFSIDNIFKICTHTLAELNLKNQLHIASSTTRDTYSYPSQIKALLLCCLVLVPNSDWKNK